MRNFFLAAVILVLGTLGCQKAKSALDWARQAADLRKADKKEEALNAYDEAIKLDPNLEEAIFNRALIYAELGRDEEAVKARDKLLTRKSPLGKKLQGLFALNSGANVSMGNDHVFKNEWDLARQKYRIALIYDQDSADAYVGLGLVCLRQKKHDDAVAEFDRAIQRNANSAIAHHNRGIANRERKEFQMAVADFTRAVELEPENPQGYEGRATAYDGLDDKAKAEDDRKKASDLKSKKMERRGSEIKAPHVFLQRRDSETLATLSEFLRVIGEERSAPRLVGTCNESWADPRKNHAFDAPSGSGNLDSLQRDGCGGCAMKRKMLNNHA